MVPAPASRRERRRRCPTLLLAIFVSPLLASTAMGETTEATAASGEFNPGQPGGPEGESPSLPVIVVDEVTITST